MEYGYKKLTDVIKDSGLFVTPEMFGAKGDGVTDDSNAFNELINKTKSTKIVIELCNKTYLLNTDIDFSNLVVNGNNASLLFKSNHGVIIDQNVRNETYTNLNNINVSGNTENIGINIVNGDHIQLNRVHVSNCLIGLNLQPSEFIENLNINSLKIDNCTIGLQGNIQSGTTKFINLVTTTELEIRACSDCLMNFISNGDDVGVNKFGEWTFINPEFQSTSEYFFKVDKSTNSGNLDGWIFIQPTFECETENLSKAIFKSINSNYFFNGEMHLLIAFQTGPIFSDSINSCYYSTTTGFEMFNNKTVKRKFAGASKFEDVNATYLESNSIKSKAITTNRINSFSNLGVNISANSSTQLTLFTDTSPHVVLFVLNDNSTSPYNAVYILSFTNNNYQAIKLGGSDKISVSFKDGIATIKNSDTWNAYVSVNTINLF